MCTKQGTGFHNLSYELLMIILFVRCLIIKEVVIFKGSFSDSRQNFVRKFFLRRFVNVPTDSIVVVVVVEISTTAFDIPDSQWTRAATPATHAPNKI